MSAQMRGARSKRALLQTGLLSLSVLSQAQAEPTASSEGSSTSPSQVVIARLQTPSGEVEVTAQALELWRELERRERLDAPLSTQEAPSGAQAEPLELTLKKIAQARHLARLLSRALVAEPPPEGLIEPLLEARRAQQHAMIWAYLKGDFERSLMAETLPERYVERAKAQNMTLFRRPELRRASHVLLHRAFDTAYTSRPPKATPQDHQALRVVAEQLRADLLERPPELTSELEARATTYQDWLPKGYQLRVEHLGLFAREGRFDPRFTEACFSLPEGERFTQPIETDFGVHVAWVRERVAPLDTPDEVIDAEVRRRSLPEVRSLELERLIERERERLVWVNEPYFLSEPP